MSLKEKIDAYKEGFKKKAPAEAQEIMHRATQALQDSDQMNHTVKVGDVAPDFSLKTASGKEVSLRALRQSGPVVISFYRGRW